jgi:spermidine/putrescine transport system substrate-binding protein
MDYVYDPANAARIAAYVQYIPPVKGVQQVFEAEGGDLAALAENPLLFPDEATQANLHSFANLPPDEEERYDAKFSEITGA